MQACIVVAEAAVKYDMPFDQRVMTNHKDDVTLLLALQCMPAVTDFL